MCGIITCVFAEDSVPRMIMGARPHSAHNASNYQSLEATEAKACDDNIEPFLDNFEAATKHIE